MNIKHKFSNINFLSEESIKEAREILKQTFLIDFNNIDKLFDYYFGKMNVDEKYYYEDKEVEKKSIVKYNEVSEDDKYVKLQRRKLFAQNIEEEIEKNQQYKLCKDYNSLKFVVHKDSKVMNDEILEKLHKVCINILQPYKISIEEYLPNIQSENSFNSWIDEYMLKNIQANIYLFNEFRKIHKEEINFHEAVEEYIKFKNYYYRHNFNNENTIDMPEKDRKAIIENNLRKKVLKLREELKDRLEIEELFYNNKKEKLCNKRRRYIYRASSNVYLYTIDNYSICKYIDKNKNYTTNSYKNNLKFIKEFLKNEINFMDVYFFERMYNNCFTLNLYNITKEVSKSIQEKDNLLRILFPLIYLPNVFDDNSNVIINFINEYNNFYKRNLYEFENGIKNLCLGLSLYMIPLYNMIFANVLDYYCKIKDTTVMDFLDEYIGRSEVIVKKNNIYKIFMEYKKIEHDEFKIINKIISQNIDFSIFNKTNIIKFIGSFNNKFVDTIYDKEKYSKIIKQFILNISYLDVM